MERSYSETEVEDILDFAEKQVFDVAQSQNGQTLLPIRNVLLN